MKVGIEKSTDSDSEEYDDFSAYSSPSKVKPKEQSKQITKGISNEVFLNVTLREFKKYSIGMKIGIVVKCFENFWSRVPDDAELFHRSLISFISKLLHTMLMYKYFTYFRFVCKKSIVKEQGAEIFDAAMARKEKEKLSK